MRYVAFLRAINVGGHTVKMEDLRGMFTSWGFSNVETFIASGNVIFDSGEQPGQIKQLIESELLKALGYEVSTFIRTPAELTAIAQYQPFPQHLMESAAALNVAFITEPLNDVAQGILASLKTDIDELHAHGTEIYWACLKKQSDSSLSNAVFEKKLGIKCTLRGMNTVKKMAEKYSLPA